MTECKTIYDETEMQINLDKIFKLPINCHMCNTKLNNDNTTVILEPVAQAIEEFPATGTEIVHMLCITKITCEECGESYLLLSPQTVAEQMATKFNDRKYDILDAMYEGDADHWPEDEDDRLGEYVCELTYVKKTQQIEMQLQEHDATMWTC